MDGGGQHCQANAVAGEAKSGLQQRQQQRKLHLKRIYTFVYKPLSPRSTQCIGK